MHVPHKSVKIVSHTFHTLVPESATDLGSHLGLSDDIACQCPKYCHPLRFATPSASNSTSQYPSAHSIRILLPIRMDYNTGDKPKDDQVLMRQSNTSRRSETDFQIHPLTRTQYDEMINTILINHSNHSNHCK